MSMRNQNLGKGGNSLRSILTEDRKHCMCSNRIDGYQKTKKIQRRACEINKKTEAGTLHL